MIRLFFLLKRKDGITHEQFREHYESSHVKLGQKYLGHLMIKYERNYMSEVRASRSQGRKPVQWDYDVMTEWVLPNQEAVDEVYRIFADPEIGKVFYDDEGNFLDRDAVLVMVVREGDVVNTGTGGGHGTLLRALAS